MDFREVLTLSGEDLLLCCRELAVLGNRVSALQTIVADRIRQESEEVPQQDSLAANSGARNTVDLLQRITGESARQTRSRLKLGRQVGYSVSMLGEVLPPVLEHVSRGLEEGHLGAESAGMISSMLVECSRVGDPEDLEYAQRSLVQAATGDDYDTGDAPCVPLHADEIRGACRRWEAGLDPDGPAPDDEERYRRRFFQMGPVRDGLVNVRGRIVAEAAAALRAITDSLDNPRVKSEMAGVTDAEVIDAGAAGADATDAGAANSGAPDGGVTDASVGVEGDYEETPLFTDSATASTDAEDDEAIAATDTRTPEQRRHDALALALDVTLRSRSLPYLGGSHATIMVEVDVKIDSQKAQVGWLRDHEGMSTAVSADTVKQLFCGAAIQAVATDSMRRIRSLGSASRIFDANQRRAISVRDQGCVIPGCSVPPAWCEIHHVKPHAIGGPTHTDNGVLLCGFHHRTIDSSGWTITMRAGVPKVQAPPWLTRMYSQEHEQRTKSAWEMGGHQPNGPP